MSLRAARFWGAKPTEFLHVWSHRDRNLAQALLMYEGSRCSGCGQPAHLAHDSDTNGFWQAETIVCQACAAIADEGKNGEQTPGATVNVRLDPDYQPHVPL